MHRKALLAILILLVSDVATSPAQDVVTIGSSGGAAGTVVSVPVSVRDLSGTSLGVDKPAGTHIQGFAFKVTFASDFVEAVTFSRGGVTSGLSAMYETTFQGSDFCSFVASFNEASNAIPFVSNAGAPGNAIGTLNVLLRATAAIGSTVTLTFHAPSAILSNQAGTVRETVADGNLALVSGTVLVAAVDPLPPPESFVATAVTTSQVDMSWNAVNGADHYQVWRSFNGGAFAVAGTPSGTTLSDTSVVAHGTYVYRVRAVTSEGGVSAFSNVDPATTTFTGDPIVGNFTLVTAIHVAEIRSAVNSLRSVAGLPSLAAEPTLAVGLTVRMQHITDLRTGLNEARSALGLSTLTFTDPTLTAGTTPVKAAHVQELRDGVK